MVLHLDLRAARVLWGLSGRHARYEGEAIMFTSTNRLCAEHNDVPSVAVPGSYNQNCEARQWLRTAASKWLL